jgi:hypothetical protein
MPKGNDKEALERVHSYRVMPNGRSFISRATIFLRERPIRCAPHSSL